MGSSLARENSSGEEAAPAKSFSEQIQEAKARNTPSWMKDWQAQDRLNNMDLTNVTSMSLLESDGRFSADEIQTIGKSGLNQSFTDMATVEMQARALSSQGLTANQIFQSSVGMPINSNVVHDGTGNSATINSSDTLGMKSLRAVNTMKEGIGELAQSLHVDKVMLAAQVLMGPIAAGKMMLQGVIGEATIGKYVESANDYVATRVNALAHITDPDFIEKGLTIDPLAANIPEQDRRAWGNIRESFSEAQGGAKFLVGAAGSLLLGMGTKAWVGSNATSNIGGRYEEGAIKFHVDGTAQSNSQYSVAYEMKLDASDWGKSDKVHFNRANAELHNALKSDPDFMAKMNLLSPNVVDRVSSVGGRENPVGFTWHHDSTPGVMQLVPRSQHSPGSDFWRTLHPDSGAAGGYSLWAIPAGAPKRK